MEYYYQKYEPSPTSKEQIGQLPEPKKYGTDRKMSGSLLERHGSGGAKSVVAKMNFLDGFRHTLRPRTKSDDFSDDRGMFNPLGITGEKRKHITKVVEGRSNTTDLSKSVFQNRDGAATEASASKCPTGQPSGSTGPPGAGLIRRWSETSSSKNPKEPVRIILS